LEGCAHGLSIGSIGEAATTIASAGHALLLTTIMRAQRVELSRRRQGRCQFLALESTVNKSYEKID